MSANVRLLRRNATLAPGNPPIYVLAMALADRDEQRVPLQVDDMSDGSAVLSRVSGGAASEGRATKGLRPITEAVDTWRLDTLLFSPPAGLLSEPLPPPDVLKIDTEGAENLVLSGAARTLREHRPRLILAAHGAERAQSVLALLREAGYVAGGWLRGAGGARSSTWSRLRPEDAPRMADNNFIASTDDADIALEPVACAGDRPRRGAALRLPGQRERTGGRGHRLPHLWRSRAHTPWISRDSR